MSGLRTACVDVVETFANVAVGGRGDDRFVTPIERERERERESIN